MTDLFDPLKLGDLELPNRVFMAPLTRTRAGRRHLANALMAEHFAQRADAGLIITDATMTAADGCAFIGEPGLYSEAHAEAWRVVTEAVHAAGGRIMVQLWHPGRAAHSLLNDGCQPISSSDRPIRSGLIRTLQGKHPYEIPRRLTLDEIAEVVAQFSSGLRHARAAGFDGVQLHGAHGYLIDQFLRDGVNDRTDIYGGSIEGRMRLLLELLDEACAVFGPGRVAVRVSPLVDFNDMHDSDPAGLMDALCLALNARQIAFLELRQADHQLPAEVALLARVRQRLAVGLVVNGGYTAASARAVVAEGLADAVAFGRPYISNPDLVGRLQQGYPLAPWDTARFYTPGPEGYTDYPAMATPATHAANPA